MKFLNVLLIGQASSGKSSFINTCATALLDENRIVTKVAVLEPMSSGVTTDFCAKPLKINEERFLPVRLFDCRGLHSLNGIHDDDIIKICEGNIKSGYKFDPARSISTDHDKFRKEPSLSDKMHCVVYVAAADIPKEMLADAKAADQLKTLRMYLSGENISQLLLLNKIDRLGIKNINTIFKNRMVKETCEGAKEFMDMPMGNILPMINYADDVLPVDMKDFLALYSLWQMMNKAYDYVTAQLDIPDGFYD
ncbi:interferon-induced protein 44-like [Ostrea edulis]|uniref:interferon-induced protein 44-like n=1 Tax=Ostrea edulis TaxID=37623 RepID=UPI0024AF47AA|nr:interferon-induced protein 44-like [Ostrea edulis]